MVTRNTVFTVIRINNQGPGGIKGRIEVGGRGRTRTSAPLLATQVLSQLSYTPILSLGAPACTDSSESDMLARMLRCVCTGQSGQDLIFSRS
jgi:hypothetical protein